MNQLMDDVRRDAILKFQNAEQDQTEQEKVSVIVSELLYLDMIVKKEGLLALERELDERVGKNRVDKLLHKIGIIILDGVEPEMIEEIMTNIYWTDNAKGADALLYYLCIRCLMLIQKECNSILIAEVCQSLIPKAYYDDARRRFEEKNEKWDSAHEEEVKEKFSHTCYQLNNSEHISLLSSLEATLITLSDQEIQKMLRQIENCHVERVLIMLSEMGRNKILTNCSKRLATILMEDACHSKYTMSEEEAILSLSKFVR